MPGVSEEGMGIREPWFTSGRAAKWGALSTQPSTFYMYLSFDPNNFISRHLPEEIIGQLPRIYKHGYSWQLFIEL